VQRGWLSSVGLLLERPLLEDNQNSKLPTKIHNIFFSLLFCFGFKKP
jgi:hypothetical protein